MHHWREGGRGEGGGREGGKGGGWEGGKEGRRDMKRGKGGDKLCECKRGMAEDQKQDRRAGTRAIPLP